MSYDIELVCACCDQPLQLDEPFQEGGTQAIGGTTACDFNVTYNYVEHFRDTMGPKGVRTIYGMTGAEALPILRQAIETLGTELDTDYWAPTAGNAGAALARLASFAEKFPNGVFRGD